MTSRTTLGRWALVAAAALCFAPALRAATITVNSTADCDTVGCDGGNATLRMAIESVNAGSNQGDVVADVTNAYGTNDTIQFSLTYPATIILGSALPSLSANVAIVGPGAANLTVSGNNQYQVFFVTNGATVSISGITLSGGLSEGGEGGYGESAGSGGGGAAGMGGAIFVDTGVTANVSNVRFFDDTATGGDGGGTGGSSSSFPGGGGGGFDLHDGFTATSNSGGNGGDGGPLGGSGGAGGGNCTPAGNATGDGAGGGGSGPCNAASGGSGGFAGGGGGGGGFGIGGNGGFGGGGGGEGNGGLFAGSGATACGGGEGGGGGAGLGGAIFVRDGATLNLNACDFDSNVANRGSGGVGDCATGGNGQGKGGAIFAMDNATVNEDCGSTFENNLAADGDNDIHFLGTITKGDTTDPVITCPPDQLNVPNDAGLCSATVDPGTATATDNCGVASIQGVRSDAAALGDPYPVGTTTITWTATDTSGNTAQCTQTISVVDTEKPVVSSSVSVGVLANDHTMRNVGYTESASDNCGGNLSNSVLIEIYSSEPEQAPTGFGGDGTTSPDARGRGTCYNSGIWVNKIALRQERLNNGPGRVYLIKTSATDASGNTGWSCATVVSPRSNKKTDLNKVLAAASAVRDVCNQFGAIPSNYYSIGCGPVIGSKQ